MPLVSGWPILKVWLMGNVWLLSDAAFTIFTITIAKEKWRWLLIKRMMWRVACNNLLLRWLGVTQTHVLKVEIISFIYVSFFTYRTRLYTYNWINQKTLIYCWIEHRQLTFTTSPEQQVEHYQVENNNTSVSTVARRAGAGAPCWYTLRCVQAWSQYTTNTRGQERQQRGRLIVLLYKPIVGSSFSNSHGRSWHCILPLPAMYPSMRRRKRHSSKRSSTVCS